MTSSYKPLGYYEGRLPSENTLKWVIAQNSKIKGNCRLSDTLLDKQNDDNCYGKAKYFYNDNYLRKLLQLNIKAFNFHYDLEYKNKIFENGIVREGGVAYYIANHNMEFQGPMLALIHAAFGDPILETCYKDIIIPDEPGLRDVIQLKVEFDQHSWLNIQALLYAYSDVNIVRSLLEKLPPKNIYFVQDNRLKISDDTYEEYIVLWSNNKLFTFKDGHVQPYIED